jgi:hypothetical protein
MRLNSNIAALALTTAATAACGGGTNPPKIIDSPEAVDSPQAAACPVCGPDSPCTSNGAQATTMGGLILAADANGTPIPANSCNPGGNSPCDWFTIPTAGANTGKKSFFILAGTPAELNTGDSGSEVTIGIELVSNGAFVAGTTNFATDPTAITSAQLFATPMGTTAYSAIAYVVNVSGTTINALYMSTSGSIMVTQINDQPNGVIKGTVSTTNFSETDGMTTGGCTTSLDGLTFAMTQGAVTPLQGPADGTGGGISNRAEEMYKAIKAYQKL